MKSINLKILIGNVAKNLIPKDHFAYVDVSGIYIPSGIDSSSNHAKIYAVSNLGIYVTDWYDILRFFEKPLDMLKANITLNILSNHKVFKGQEIISFIEKLSKKSKEEIYALRNFDI